MNCIKMSVVVTITRLFCGQVQNVFHITCHSVVSRGMVVQWLACWTSDLKVGCSMPTPRHRVVSFDKKFNPTLPLSTQVYKWVRATFTGGNPAMN